MITTHSENDRSLSFQANYDRKVSAGFSVKAGLARDSYFFRHTKQFNYLHDIIFPSILKMKDSLLTQEVSIWSAACYTGEEPYSIALTCRHFLNDHPSWRFKLYASDSDQAVIKQAKEGVYGEESLKYVPDTFKMKYFVFNQDNNSYIISMDTRKLVDFYHHSLLNRFPIQNLDIIFIRDIMLYFDRHIKFKIVNKLLDVLSTKGHIFISPSESLLEFEPRVKLIFPGIYQKL